MFGKRGIGIAKFAAAVWCAAVYGVCADPYNDLARNLTHDSISPGIRRVAVLPFTTTGGNDSDVGLALSERLITRLFNQHKVEVVERTLLKRVLDEQGLGYKGFLDPLQSKRIGRILGVDAIVTGTFLHLPDGALEINARLIDAESARILAAGSVRAANEWRESPFNESGPVVVAPPDLDALERSAEDLASNFRDSPASETDCSDWETRAWNLQNSALELKARYWAARLRDPGFSPAQLTRNPGSELQSLELRQQLYARIRELYNAGYQGGISAQDRDQVEQADQRADRLQQRCDR